MKKNKKQPLEVPPIEVLEKELHRELYKKSYRSAIRSTVYTLMTVAAVAVLVATLVLPVLQMIDKAQRDGTISTLDLSRFMRGGFISGGFTSSGNSSGGSDRVEYVYDSEMKQLLRENIKMMETLANKKIEVPWYGKGGIKEKMERSAKYEQKISGK